MPRLAWIPIAFALLLGGAIAQSDNRIDLQRPDAPELAAFGTYEVVTRDGTPAQLTGRAVRDAAAAADGGPYPLVVLSTATRANAT